MERRTNPQRARRKLDVKVRAEGMMREHSHTMIEYRQKLEERDDSLTVADPVACSGIETHPPGN